MTVRSLAILALITSNTAFANGASNTTNIRGGLLGKALVLGALSEIETAKMEDARSKFLNDDGQKNESWIGDKTYEGEFVISPQDAGQPEQRRYTLQGSNAPCVNYVHYLYIKQIGNGTGARKYALGEELNSQGQVEKVPSVKRTKVCLIDGQWTKYAPSMGTLVPRPVAGLHPQTVPQAPQQQQTERPAQEAPKASAADSLALTGPTGEDHRFKFPQAVGPEALGRIIHSFKVLEIKLNEAIEGLKKQNPQGGVAPRFASEQTWVKSYADNWVNKQLGPNNVSLGFDQLASILKEIKSEEARKTAVESFKSRVDDRIGEISMITTLFENAQIRNEVRALLSGEKAPTEQQPPRRRRR